MISIYGWDRKITVVDPYIAAQVAQASGSDALAGGDLEYRFVLVRQGVWVAHWRVGGQT